MFSCFKASIMFLVFSSNLSVVSSASSIISIASGFPSTKNIFFLCSIFLLAEVRILLSISSIAAGLCFNAIRFPSKLSSNVVKCAQIKALFFGGSGIRFSLNSTPKPNVPSEPAKSFERLNSASSVSQKILLRNISSKAYPLFLLWISFSGKASTIFV